MKPIGVIWSESKMAVLLFVLDKHNGISIYHMLDRAIYLTGIGFFASVNKSWKKIIMLNNRGVGEGGIQSEVNIWQLQDSKGTSYCGCKFKIWCVLFFDLLWTKQSHISNVEKRNLDVLKAHLKTMESKNGYEVVQSNLKPWSTKKSQLDNKTYIYPSQGICNYVEGLLTSYWRSISIQYALGICGKYLDLFVSSISDALLETVNLRMGLSDVFTVLTFISCFKSIIRNEIHDINESFSNSL